MAKIAVAAMILALFYLYNGVDSNVTMSTNPDALSWTGSFTPSISHQVKLHGFYGHFLSIAADGKVSGILNANSEYVKLEFQNVGSSLKRIKGLKTGKYVGMNADGRVFSTTTDTVDTIFKEEFLANGYYTYASFKYYNRNKYDAFLALRKTSGLPRKGINTLKYQNTSYFLTV